MKGKIEKSNLHVFYNHLSIVWFELEWQIVKNGSTVSTAGSIS